MAVNFTPAQQEVIDLRDCNILVSAAAGSGKTAVLVERIAQMVCDEEHPVDIDRLLVVTFTNAAAQEMRERVGAAIAARLEEQPESEHLQRQAALLHNALITTIDSFSLFLIRNHFNEVGLDPNFRVADEGEIKLLEGECMEELLEEQFAKKDPAFLDCVEFFQPEGKDGALAALILQLTHYAQSFPWPEDWLLERKEDYGVNSGEAFWESPCGVFLKKYISATLEGFADTLQALKKLCELPAGPYMYGKLLEEEEGYFREASKLTDFSKIGEALQKYTSKNLPPCRDQAVNADIKEYVSDSRNAWKKDLAKFKTQFFVTSMDKVLEQGKTVGQNLCVLVDLSILFAEKLREKKREKRLVDFNDMEHLALDILLRKEGEKIVPSPVALEYRQHFQEVLIDEYQDSNLVQEYLLKAVSGEEDGHCNRFMVGDVKQSIYKFRLARPELFLEKYETYREHGDFRKIVLSKNFRSREQVLTFVNRIFEGIMNAECGGIVYDDQAALYLGATYLAGESCDSEVILVEKPGEAWEYDAAQTEALAIANRIRELMKNYQVTDKETKKPRPAKYSDIVLLFQTGTAMESMKEILEKQGIPVYIPSKKGYFSATEVQELLNFLRVLNNPYQDIPFYGVLRSVFGDFSEEEIATMKARYPKEDLYNAFCLYGQEQEDEIAGKAKLFYDRLQEYREKMYYQPIRTLLEGVISDYDYANYVTALPAGVRRRANIEMLLTKASDFESTSFFGVFHFIQYIEQLEKYDVDMGEADVVDENANLVRMMTIHKSKGLEFPIVFVVRMSQSFNMKDSQAKLLIDAKLGMATGYVDVKKRVKKDSLRQSVLALKSREDCLAENLRVLYVALTRAKEKLILTGISPYPKESYETFCKMLQKEKLSYYEFMKADCFWDFVIPMLDRTGRKPEFLGMEQMKLMELTEDLQGLEKREILRQSEALVSLEDLECMTRRMSLEYPYRYLENLYTKTTVSELKIAAMCDKDEAAYNTFEEKEMVPYVPKFLREEQKEIGGTVRGNAYHRAMELLDFAGVLEACFSNVPETYEDYQKQFDEQKITEKIMEELQKRVADKRLTKEYYDALRPEKLTRFLQSDLGRRMWMAQRKGTLYREQPFVLGIDAKRLHKDFPGQETILIQGIMDAFFVEEGKVILLDYKTDSIASMEALWKRYETQVDYYSEALSRLMELPVEEKYLYSFHLGAYER